MATRDRLLPRFVFGVVALFFVLGLVVDGPEKSLKGFLALQTSPARLLSDFTLVAGAGAALLNAGMVGLLGISVLKLNKIDISGPTAAAIFTMVGFALFGKTLFGCIPLILGVSLAALLVGKKPREYVIIALFGTALAPIVSYVAWETGLQALYTIPASLVIGTLVGVVLPPLAIAMLHLHQGYNLYNVGFTAGFAGLFIASISNAGGVDISALNEWNGAPLPALAFIVPGISLGAIAIGCARGGKKTWKQFLSIQKFSGRLPTDYADLVGSDGTLVNMGIMGLAYSAYIFAVGAPFNGPVVGGLMTILGFSFFGKNIRNALPVFVGLMLAAIIFGKNLAESWVVLAFLFGTALSPLAGEFGPIVGVVAGFLHLVMVERTGLWHGGMNLYNNGFSAGLIATIIVAVIEWYRNNVEA